MRYVVSHHAVERFIARHATDLSWEAAEELLLKRFEAGVRLRTKTLLGQLQYEIQDPYCVLVVKADRQELVCVTVLPRPEFHGKYTEDELEIIREMALRMPAAAPHEIKNPPPKPKKASPGSAKVEGRELPPFKAPPPKPAPSPPVLVRRVPAKPKEPKATRQARGEALQKLLLERAIVREQEKTRRHVEGQEKMVGNLKKCLRQTLRYMVARAAEGDPEAVAILHAVQEVEPGLVTDEFLVGRAV